MNRQVFKRSNERINKILAPESVDQLVSQFAPLWDETDDDKTVIAKFRSYRAKVLSEMRLRLIGAEVAAHRRLKQK